MKWKGKAKYKIYLLLILILLVFLKDYHVPDSIRVMCSYSKDKNIKFYMLYDIKGSAGLIGFRENDTVLPIRNKMEKGYFYSTVFVEVDSVKPTDDNSIIVLYKKGKYYGRLSHYIFSHILPIVLSLIFIYKFLNLFQLKKMIKGVLAGLMLLLLNSIFYKTNLIYHFYFNFLLFVFNILVLFMIMYFFKQDSHIILERDNHLSHKWYDIFLLFLFWFFYSFYYFTLEFPTMDSIRIMDTFHVGEVLSQYIGIKMGLSLYKDIFSVHGLLADPFIAKISMILFGESIGSYYIGNILWSSIATLILMFVIYKNTSRNVFYLFLFFVFLCGFRFYYFTDKYLLLYLIYLMERENRLLNHIIGFIVAYISLLYSIEVGLSSFVFMVILVYLRKDKKGFLIGFFTGSIIFLTMLWGKLTYYLEFIVYVVRDYHNVFSISNFAFPCVYNIDMSALFILFIMSISLWMLVLYVKKNGFIKSSYYIAFYISSFIAFLPAIGRNDAFSLGVRIVPAVLFFFIMLNFYSKIYIYGFLILLLFFYPYPDLEFANSINVIKSMPHNIKTIDFMVKHKNNLYYLDKDYKDCYIYLKNKQADVYSLSSEGIWYYLLEIPHYTRFMLPIFANTNKYQEDIINDIEKRKIKYIVYNVNIWSFYPGNKHFKFSRPVLWKYINTHYYKDTVFGDIIVLKRKE